MPLAEPTVILSGPFPEGSTVGLYDQHQFVDGREAPISSALDTTVVTNSEITFTLAADLRYAVAAQVGGVWQKRLVVGEGPPAPDPLAQSDQLGSLATVYAVDHGVDGSTSDQTAGMAAAFGAVSTRGKIQLPSGDIRISAALAPAGIDNFALVGNGPATRVRLAAGLGTFLRLVSFHRMVIHDLTVVLDGDCSDSDAVFWFDDCGDIYVSSTVRLENVGCAAKFGATTNASRIEIAGARITYNAAKVNSDVFAIYRGAGITLRSKTNPTSGSVGIGGANVRLEPQGVDVGVNIIDTVKIGGTMQARQVGKAASVSGLAISTGKAEGIVYDFSKGNLVNVIEEDLTMDHTMIGARRIISFPVAGVRSPGYCRHITATATRTATDSGHVTEIHSHSLAELDDVQIAGGYAEYEEQAAVEMFANNEVQRIQIPVGTTGGTWKVKAPDGTGGMAATAWNASALDVQAALEAMAGIGADNVVVKGGPLPITDVATPAYQYLPYEITFRGSKKRTNLAAMTDDGSALTGAAAAPTITTLANGNTDASLIRGVVFDRVKTQDGEQNPAHTKDAAYEFDCGGFMLLRPHVHRQALSTAKTNYAAKVTDATADDYLIDIGSNFDALKGPVRHAKGYTANSAHRIVRPPPGAPRLPNVGDKWGSGIATQSIVANSLYCSSERYIENVAVFTGLVVRISAAVVGTVHVHSMLYGLLDDPTTLKLLNTVAAVDLTGMAANDPVKVPFASPVTFGPNVPYLAICTDAAVSLFGGQTLWPKRLYSSGSGGHGGYGSEATTITMADPLTTNVIPAMALY